MNIFILDRDVEKSVRYHPDKHVVKMPVESTQMLCSVYYFGDQEVPENAYKLSNYNHPCSIWVRRSLSNWLWLRNFTLILGAEYSYRYGNKKHASVEKCKTLPRPIIPDIGMTPFCQAVPPEFQGVDPVKAYRAYFVRDKQHLKQYSGRNVPEWFVELR